METKKEVIIEAETKQESQENKENESVETKSTENKENTETTEKVDDIEKIKELERLYNEKVQQVVEKEKELQPVIQLQQFLLQNPDKAQKIASILNEQETSSSGSKEEQKDDLDKLFGFTEETDKKPNDERESEILKLKKELDSLKEQIVKSKETEVVEQEKEFLVSKLSEFEKDKWFDKEKFFARLMSYPDGYLDSLSNTEYEKLLKNTAKIVALEKEREFNMKFNDYIKEKKNISEKTKSETKSSVIGEQKKQETITMDNAKNIAKKILEAFKK